MKNEYEKEINTIDAVTVSLVILTSFVGAVLFEVLN